MTTFRIPLTATLFALLCLFAFALATAFAPLPTILAVAALPALALRGTVTIPRALLLPTTLVLALVIFSNLGELRQASPMAAVPAAYPAGLLLGVLLVAYVYRRNDEKEGLAVLLLSSLLLMDAGVTTEPFPFALVAGAAVVALALSLRTWMPGTPLGTAPPWDRPTALAALLLAPVCVLAFFVAMGLRWSEAGVNRMLNLADPSMGAGLTFQARTTLESMTGMRSERVLARLHSSSPPLYLFARAYYTYKDKGSTWEGMAFQPQEEFDRARLSPEGLPQEGHVFEVQPLSVDVLGSYRPERVDTVDLTVICGNVFVPRDAVLVGVAVQQMSRDAGGSLLPLPVTQGLPPGRYWIARGRSPGPVVRESPEMLQACLQVPPAVREYARPLVDRVTGGAPTPEARLSAVQDWFHANFQYDTAWRKRDADPLKQFLLEKTPSHCEFFAAGMTLMLRSQGIPARYVTGFMVYEKNGPGGYTVIRDEHAHAWVEAWLDHRGWVTCDPTPPRAAQSPSPSAFTQWLDYALYQLGELKARLTSFSWRGLVRAFLEGVQALGRWLIEQPWRVVLLLAIFAVEALFRRADSPGRRWLRRFRHVPTPSSLDPEEAMLQAVLERFEAWTSLWGPPRPPHLTLLEWARVMEERASDAGDSSSPEPRLSPEARARAIEFLRSFSNARYSAPHVSAEDLQALEERVADLEREQPPRGRRQERPAP